MLTRLRFKNWRSLKEETIDFTTPITVLIGANSSGKTNIVDGLRFYRDSLNKTLITVVMELEYMRIQTDALHNDGDVELEYTHETDYLGLERIVETFRLHFDKRTVPFHAGKRLLEGTELIDEEAFREFPRRDVLEINSYSIPPEAVALEEQRRKRRNELYPKLYALIRKRWQILGEHFSPPLEISRRSGGDPYVIEPDGSNTVTMLDFMENVAPQIFEQFQEDLSWLLQHVTSVRIHQSRNDELELDFYENGSKKAWTVSAGTSRVAAMLAAVYALELPQEYGASSGNLLTFSAPGLVVIEEPDTALNPGLLGRFVELLRTYTERADAPRQFILTTHNPTLLDYFQPEEVRVVERDEQGYTQVKRIPDYIKDIWLDEYGLGEVWMTNSFGGKPE
jgi:hypothetical protein